MVQGLNLGQLRAYVVRPTLRYLAESNLLPWSLSAENLVLGTIYVESAGKYLRQVGAGPALGIIQMEPATHDDIWRNWLEHPMRRPLAERVRKLDTQAHITDGAAELVGNLYYAVALCRIHYRRLPDPLPAPEDAHGMAALWKRGYNTILGAGTIARAIPFFEAVC